MVPPTPFPTRRLGVNGPMVSSLGLGTMGIGTFYGQTDRAHVFDTLNRAADMGIVFFDTADMYGNSEEVLGEWFSSTGRRSQVFLATKFGAIDLRQQAGTERVKSLAPCSDPNYIVEALYRSLGQLKTDYIDLLYQHRVDPTVPIEIVLATLKPFVEKGTVRWLGLSECSPTTLRRARAVPGIGEKVVAVQMEYSPFDLEIEENGLLQAARETGVAIVAYSPLGRGLLTGKYRSRDDFEEGDYRRTLPRFSEANFAQNVALVDRLQAIADRYGATSTQVALAWILAEHPDFFPIPGTRNISRLEENAQSAMLQLSPEDVSEIRNWAMAADVQGARKRTEHMPATQGSRILDALATPGPSSDASHRTPLQLLSTPNTVDSSGNTLGKRLRAANLQRQVQKGQSEALGDANFLSSSFSSSPAPVAAGFSLNYDKDTPLRSIDLGGEDQQQKLAEFVTRGIDNLSHGVTVQEAFADLGLKSQKDLLPGLEVRLLPHQAIGVSWMLKRERGHDRGGILGDDMGLGKTVQMIATMVMNLPKDDDEHRTTLIVVPAALLQQWKDEIESKTNEMFRVHVHHGKDKLKKTSEVKGYDVVITTYHTLCADFAIPSDVEASEESQWLLKHGGVLARTKFHRAIADEAQYIRNRSTKASISLAHVRARHRWMLTGTPVTNTLADIYGLLRFGHFRPYNDWPSFNEHIARVQLEDAPLAGNRAQVVLRPLMLRRTKNSTLEGEPILKLPNKDIQLVKLRFSDEEREIYDTFERRTKIRLNRFIRAGTVVKKVMILRLRQLCCHPNLILSIAEGQGFEDPTLLVGSDADKERDRARKTMGKSWLEAVKKRQEMPPAPHAAEMLDREDEMNADSANCSNCKDLLTDESGRILACGHELCFDCVLDLSNSAIAHDGIFGEGDERQNNAREKEYEEASAKGLRPCPKCKKMADLTPGKIFKSAAFEPTEEELEEYARSKRQAKRPRYATYEHAKIRSVERKPLEERGIDSDDSDLEDLPLLASMRPKTETNDEDSISVSKKVAPKGQGKGKAKADDDEDVEMPSAAVISNWSRGDDFLEASTKMCAMLEMLKEWDSTGDKTICYSQWTSMLNLVETVFSRNGIRSLRFDGKMNREQRESVLVQFKQRTGPKVILISTKCGSVGLNLVSANRIINLDLSWNAASEAQAYDRAHRIGQDKPVWVKRLVVENTIEERMLKLQEVKSGLADAALGEGTGVSLHKLSVKEIRQLFGMAPADNNDDN
ncbi:SNF2 family DNA-dependent ATPase [Mycena indigotica]|uniref:SNF2 family DNA-dependent ATPase n=1 Tax=Mycena indigotica TaxID=2126181 RepID=A0A8H6W0J1_9AGAR|nr:SNF2 family DNA-dependent ATPase [Mycena indigotica]KAF7297138.1 SNF2 family DNA-dependent ATPase [Mycena indigotica]